MSAVASAASVAAGTRRTGARTGVQRERHQPAYPLMVAVIGLVAAGVVMVYSASSVRAYFSNDDPATYGMQQLIWAGIGLSAMFIASRMDFRWLRYLSIPAYLGTMALLALVLVPGIGTEVAGSRRWIQLPGSASSLPSWRSWPWCSTSRTGSTGAERRRARSGTGSSPSPCSSPPDSS